MQLRIDFVVLILILASPMALASSLDEIKKGEELANSRCNSCHDMTPGESPLLYGQSSTYLAESLRMYSSTEKEDTSTFKIMNSLASSLSEPEIVAISRYYAQEDPCKIVAVISPGDGIVADGQAKAQQCRICHKKKLASSTAKVPRIRGQNTLYLLHSLKEHRDSHNSKGMMDGELDSFNDQDLADIAAYLNRYNNCVSNAGK